MHIKTSPNAANTSTIELHAAARIKRDLSTQLRKIMLSDRVSQAELARRMHTSRAVVQRLLDDDDLSITLATISKAAVALSKVVHVEITR